MAHLWITNEEDQWAALQLESDAYALKGNLPKAIGQPVGDGPVLSEVLLLHSRGAANGAWVLIASNEAGVSVNGMPLSVGIRALEDHDEIRVQDEGTIYFSTERLARVEEFPGSDQALFCPRCKQEIEKHKSAVKCPSCGVWHHQTDELNCWTYSDACALCSQQTDLSAGFRWTPEEL
jgi:hypothetical protein